MKRILFSLALAGSLWSFTSLGTAQNSAPTGPLHAASDAVLASSAAPSAGLSALPTTTAASETASAQALPTVPVTLTGTVIGAQDNVAPKPDKGDTAWMMLCTLLVILMTVPGLALFYGGLVRGKNMLSVLMQVLVTFSLVVFLWFVYGYSLAFTEGNAVLGGWNRLLMQGVWDNVTGSFASVATFNKQVVIPEIVFAAFQATFAGITCCLIVGSLAERIKFSAMLVFMVLWFTFSYVPIAHMVWFWMGPDAYSAKSLVGAMDAKAGWIWQSGALDFAGGTVVHINAAVAGIVGAVFLGKRVGYGKEAMAPHSLTLTMVGASLLWVGWFGFNAGSALEANGFAALAFINTLVAPAAAVLTWCLGEAMHKGKASMLGAASGLVAGLVAITPAAGNVGIAGALAIGLVAGFAGLWGVTGLKRLLKADDSLDVFGVHGVCGIVGALLTGVFNSPSLGGPGFVNDWVTLSSISAADYSVLERVGIQAQAVLTTVVWSGVVSVTAYFVVDKTMGLRVTQEQERIGLDISSHGETAYNR